MRPQTDGVLSATDPGLRRVSVHAGTTVIDLALPATVPVATLIPSIVDMLDSRGADPPASLMAPGYRLSRLGAPALLASTTLAQNDIRDGAVLMLSQFAAEPPVPRHHDVAEAVSATLDKASWPFSRRQARFTGAVVAVCLTGLGGLLLVRNAFSTSMSRNAGNTAAVAALAGLIALLFATIAHRTYRDALAGLTLGLVATALAAVAGLLAVPGAPGLPNVLLAAMAAAVTSVLAMRVTHCGMTTLTATALFAIVVALAGLAGVTTACPLRAITAVSALLSIGLLEVSPRISIMLAGLSPRFDNAEHAPDRLAARAIRADNWLTSLIAAFSVSAAAGAIGTVLATHGGGRSWAFAALTGALLLLRARSDGRRTLLFVVSGIATIAATFAVTAVSVPRHGPWIAATTAMAAALAFYFGFVASAMSLSPVARRGVELLEYLAFLAMVPVTCWICGLFSAIRGLNLI